MSLSEHEIHNRVTELLNLYGDSEASLASLLCDRHPDDAVAYTVIEADLRATELSYGDLKRRSERFAAGLSELGVRPGDRVATLLGKNVEHLVTVMAIWRLGAVHVPLFTAFAPAAIAARVIGSGAKAVVCDGVQRSKLIPGDDMPASQPWQVIVVGDGLHEGDVAMDDLFLNDEARFPAAAALGGSAPMVEIYTSGTTGNPKAVVVPTVALASFHAYMEFGLGLGQEDFFWNAADPGWGYGLYFGILGSLCMGVPSVWLNSGFSVALTWDVLSTQRVSNFAAAPTVYRALRASDVPVPDGLALRAVSAAGEPLTPEVNAWAEKTLGLQVHDHYGQTEAGMLLNNHHHPALKRPLVPGSMGHPMPGWKAAILHEDRDEQAPADTMGRIAFDLTASPLAWFSGYLNDPERSAEKFTEDGRWYLTGDTGRVDENGYFHFVSRDDDVIIMSGYRIGPFEVESVLLTHPAVTQAAVIAAPDTLRGEVLEAFVVLRDTASGTPGLVEELQELVKTKFAAHAYPRAIHFVRELPMTPSGKIQRYVLRQRRQSELQDAPS